MVTTGTSTPQYTPSGDAMLCYDCGEWHASCPTVELQYPYLYCPSCRCVAHIDLVATHITTESSREARHE